MAVGIALIIHVSGGKGCDVSDGRRRIREMACGHIVFTSTEIIKVVLTEVMHLNFWRTLDAGAEAAAAVGHQRARALLESRASNSVTMRGRDPSRRNPEFRNMLCV